MKYNFDFVEGLSSDEKEALKNTNSFKEAVKIVTGSSYNPEILDLVASDQKRIMGYPLGDPELNRRGLHAVRAAFSHRNIKDKAEKTFIEKGLIKHENFLKDEKWIDQIIEEFDRIPHSPHKMKKNILHYNNLPGMRNAIENTNMKMFVLSYSGLSKINEAYTLYYNNTFAQKIVNSEDDNDNQKNYHIDTFFPAVKFWYFPEDVEEWQGPFSYAENSCFLNQKMLEWHYEQSCLAATDKYPDWKLKDHKEGSFRVDEKEIEELGYKAFTRPVKRDTLVIANVAGFHARGRVEGPPHERKSIHGSIRISKPFW